LMMIKQVMKWIKNLNDSWVIFSMRHHNH
jgi:hypothetical protein